MLAKLGYFIVGGLFAALAVFVILWLLIEFVKWLISVAILLIVGSILAAVALYLGLLGLAHLRGRIREERLRDWIDSDEWSTNELECERDAIRGQIRDRVHHLRQHPLVGVFALNSVDSLRRQEAQLSRAVHRARPAIPVEPNKSRGSARPRRLSPVRDRLRRKAAIDRERDMELRAILKNRVFEDLSTEEQEEYMAVKNRAVERKREIDGENTRQTAIVPAVVSPTAFSPEDEGEPDERDDDGGQGSWKTPQYRRRTK